jgi:superfamily I DNA/RNA helicase
MIGILHLGADAGAAIAAELNARGVDAVCVDGRDDVRFADQVVKVVSLRRSKGLDFPALFVLMPDRADISKDPITWADRDTSLEARRVLYVAATRASRKLVLVASSRCSITPLIVSRAAAAKTGAGASGVRMPRIP